MNYYCLIAGLPDIEIDDNKMVFGIVDFKEEARLYLSSDDMQLLGLFYLKFDNQNLLRYLKDKEVIFDKRGNITKEEFMDGLELSVENNNAKSQYIVPPYFSTFMEEYRSTQSIDTNETNWENRLTELYYQWAMRCGNKMIASWFEFNMNLNNIISAYAGRKYQMNVEVVGSNEVAESIKTSSQRDFGLTGTIDELETFQQLTEETDLFEREKKIDLLKWQWLDEQTFFKYFSIEKVFAYLVKLEIIERWTSLDSKEGEKIFRELINSLKESVVNERELKIEN
jgi:hypothetical protein